MSLRNYFLLTLLTRCGLGLLTTILARNDIAATPNGIHARGTSQCADEKRCVEDRADHSIYCVDLVARTP